MTRKAETMWQKQDELRQRRVISLGLILLMVWPLLGAFSIEPQMGHDHPISTKEGDHICFTITDQNGDPVEGEIEITDRDGGKVEGTWETRDADGNVVDSGTFTGTAPCCKLSGEFESTQGGGKGTFGLNLNNGKGRWQNSTTGDSGKISDGENCEEDSDCEGCVDYELEFIDRGDFV